MEDKITYTYSTPLIEEESRGDGNVVRFVIIDVNNNVGLPLYKYKGAYNPPFLDESGTMWYLTDRFEKSPPRIPGNTFKGENYPKEGTLKSLWDQDPIIYHYPPSTSPITIVDKENNDPLIGVKIKDLEGKKATWDDDKWQITGEYSPGKVQKLIFNFKGYTTTTKVITTKSGGLREDINVIELNPSKKSSASSILKSKGTSEGERERMTEEEKKDFLKETAKKVIQKIKEMLIPIVINKLCCEPFGVCDPIGLYKQAIKLAKDAKEKKEELQQKREEKKAEKEEEKLAELAEEEVNQPQTPTY